MSDKQYRVWISTLPSCISGRFSEYVDGAGRNVACHVRRANNSGTGFKPEFACVPMTDEEHKYQHQHGELAAILRFGQGRSGILDCSVDGAKFWYDEKVRVYNEMWRRKHAEN